VAGEVPAVIGSVAKNCPAQAAGLRSGDVILKVGGSGVGRVRTNGQVSFNQYRFLGAKKRLYKRLRRSVGPSVGRSVRWSVPILL
jgi:S1-C subfamily serine protease